MLVFINNDDPGQCWRLPDGFFRLTALLNWVRKCFVKKVGLFLLRQTCGNVRSTRVTKSGTIVQKGPLWYH